MGLNHYKMLNKALGWEKLVKEDVGVQLDCEFEFHQSKVLQVKTLRFLLLGF